MSVRNLFYTNEQEISRAEKRAYAREALLYNVTEDILVLLEDLGVSKNELAERLGKSRSYVTQVLSGTRNMTLGTLSDICFALNAEPQVEIHFEKMPVRHELDWELDEIVAPVGELIKKSENVIDCRQQDEWTSHGFRAA